MNININTNTNMNGGRGLKTKRLKTKKNKTIKKSKIEKSNKKRKITKNDYVKILKYYDKSIPSNNADIKQKAEDIISGKLCRCIKKINKTYPEPKSIGICTSSVINSKGYNRGAFKCKDGREIELKK